jgi:hypothetical protein
MQWIWIKYHINYYCLWSFWYLTSGNISFMSMIRFCGCLSLPFLWIRYDKIYALYCGSFCVLSVPCVVAYSVSYLYYMFNQYILFPANRWEIRNLTWFIRDKMGTIKKTRFYTIKFKKIQVCTKTRRFLHIKGLGHSTACLPVMSSMP